jgi:hypothetical protein
MAGQGPAPGRDVPCSSSGRCRHHHGVGRPKLPAPALAPARVRTTVTPGARPVAGLLEWRAGRRAPGGKALLSRLNDSVHHRDGADAWPATPNTAVGDG